MKNLTTIQDSKTLTISFNWNFLFQMIRNIVLIHLGIFFSISLIIWFAVHTTNEFQGLNQLVVILGLVSLVLFVISKMIPFFLEGVVTLTKEADCIIIQRKRFNKILSSKKILQGKIQIMVFSIQTRMSLSGYSVKLNASKKNFNVISQGLSADDSVELCYLLKDFIGSNAEIIKKLNWVGIYYLN